MNIGVDTGSLCYEDIYGFNIFLSLVYLFDQFLLTDLHLMDWIKQVNRLLLGLLFLVF